MKVRKTTADRYFVIKIESDMMNSPEEEIPTSSIKQLILELEILAAELKQLLAEVENGPLHQN